MKIVYRAFLVIWLLLVSTGSYAQNSDSDPDKVYGLDPLLYNGRFYSYFLPAGTGGTPFFNGPGFVNGSVTIRGVTYDSLSLKYDVFNQQLILLYKTSVGAKNLIVVSDAWLESFSLAGSHFELLAIQDTIRQIYQVIGTGPTVVLYQWRKDLAIDGGFGNESYAFSKSKRDSYLLIGKKLLKYKKNKSFVAQFDLANQAALKKYLRQERVKLKKASDKAVSDLIKYCNSLSPK
jgi:hypothetical protein